MRDSTALSNVSYRFVVMKSMPVGDSAYQIVVSWLLDLTDLGNIPAGVKRLRKVSETTFVLLDFDPPVTRSLPSGAARVRCCRYMSASNDKVNNVLKSLLAREFTI